MIPPSTCFSSIPIEVPYKMIMMRLGYRTRTTTLSEVQKDTVDQTISAGFSYCKPAGCWRRITIAERNEYRIVLQDGSMFDSKSVVNLLHNSSAVVCMATTVGPDIVKAASDAVAQGEGAIAVIYDAVGGQTADAAMNWINEYIRQQLVRRGERLTKQRFSPGYGDFDLKNQKVIYSLLDLVRLDIYLSSRYMLIPEKSVTAIAGIEDTA